MASPLSPRTARPGRFAASWILSAAIAGALVACSGGGDATGPARDTRSLALDLALPRLDTAREGHYQAWSLSSTGARVSLGQFVTGGSLSFTIGDADVARIEVTLEPPADSDPAPSDQVLLRGAVENGVAQLSYVGAVTQSGVALREAPGQFTMFTPSDNATAGYPSHEEAGVWLFNMSPGETVQRDYYVRMSQLTAGWTYEGWMVRDIGRPGEIWLSYGKFVPDWTGALNQPDDTGWGPFSGVTDFRTVRVEDFPGDDWISNPLGLPWPSVLPLPLDLREKDASGALRWTHVITIEPARDRGEPLTTERPFFMRPYVDPFGDLPPGVARTITTHLESMPRGTATIR